jgi:hypothetical protein
MSNVLDHPQEVVGKEFWFEYHCWESLDSSDAPAWLRSHERVTVLGLADCEVLAPTFDERVDGAVQIVYRARWSDGFEWDIWEDELCLSPSEFYCADPPKR